MRSLALALCLLFGPLANDAFAQERVSLTASEAVDICEAWLGGTFADEDALLQGWRRLESQPGNVLLMPAPSTRGAMDQVSLIQEDYPGAEQRHCAFRWRFDDAANHLANAAAALASKGFRTQEDSRSEADAVVVASRMAQEVTLARATMRVVPCQPTVIGPHRGSCAGSTVAELSLYVVETRQRN